MNHPNSNEYAPNFLVGMSHPNVSVWCFQVVQIESIDEPLGNMLRFARWPVRVAKHLISKKHCAALSAGYPPVDNLSLSTSPWNTSRNGTLLANGMEWYVDALWNHGNTTTRILGGWYPRHKTNKKLSGSGSGPCWRDLYLINPTLQLGDVGAWWLMETNIDR